jgi:hypothetical protein
VSAQGTAGFPPWGFVPNKGWPPSATPPNSGLAPSQISLDEFLHLVLVGPAKQPTPSLNYRIVDLTSASNGPNFSASRLQDDLIEWALGWPANNQAALHIEGSSVTRAFKST